MGWSADENDEGKEDKREADEGYPQTKWRVAVAAPREH